MLTCVFSNWNESTLRASLGNSPIFTVEGSRKEEEEGKKVSLPCKEFPGHPTQQLHLLTVCLTVGTPAPQNKAGALRKEKGVNG